MLDLKGEICEANSFPTCKEIKYYAHENTDDVGNMKTGISTSVVSTDSKHRSTLAFEDNSKCHETDVHSSSTRHTSVKSEVSTETHLPLGNGSFEMTYDSQHKTESSCSNSLSVMLPISFPNQETSKEAYLFRNCGSSIDSSNSKAFDRSPEEPVTASSESVVSAQIASSAVRNAKFRISLTDGNHSSSMTKKGDEEISHETATPEDGLRREFVAEFDLNEDISANALDDCIQPVGEMLLAHSVIRVVAKAGFPSGQPMFPLKFEGLLGWKDPAETSAFRPVLFSKTSDRKMHSINHRRKDIIDLNVAAVDDNADLRDSHLEVDTKQAKSHWIDLNCLYDAADEFTQPSLQPKTENSPLVDLNSNSNNVHWHQSLGNKTLDYRNPGNRDFNFTSCDYLAELRTAPHFLQPVELMHRVASLQPKLPIVSPTLHPYGYSSLGTMPYTRYYRENGIFPEVLNPGAVNASFDATHIAAAIPTLDVKTEDNVSTSGSKMDKPKLFPFFAPMGERVHQEAWYSTSMKRKEPEGGLECYQLDYKQVI